MSQIRLDPEGLHGDRFVIVGSEARHLIQVLRRKAGDEIQLFDGQGKQYKGILSRIDLKGHRVEGRIKDPASQARARPKLALYQGLPKGAKFDFVVEKATELGVDEIIPFLSEKSLLRLEDSARSARLPRWQRLAEAAAKQCDRPDMPAFQPVQNLQDIDWKKIGGATLVFDKSPGSRELKSVLSSLELSGQGRFNLLVGPESGFSPAEIARLEKAGAARVSLGELTLRTETAGLAALVLLRHELGRL